MRQTRPSLASLTKSSLTTGTISSPVPISVISKLPEELSTLAVDDARSRPGTSSAGADEMGPEEVDGVRGADAGARVGEREGESTGVDDDA